MGKNGFLILFCLKYDQKMFLLTKMEYEEPDLPCLKQQQTKQQKNRKKMK